MRCDAMNDRERSGEKEREDNCPSKGDPSIQSPCAIDEAVREHAKGSEGGREGGGNAADRGEKELT